VIHCAAIVGGIANFHRLPYTLTEVNNALYNSVIGAAGLREQVERFPLHLELRWVPNATLFPTRRIICPDCLRRRSA